MLTPEQYTTMEAELEKEIRKVFQLPSADLIDILKDNGHSTRQLEQLTGLGRSAIRNPVLIQQPSQPHANLACAVANVRAVFTLCGHDVGWWETPVVATAYYFTPWDTLVAGNAIQRFAIAYAQSDEERKEIVQAMFPDANLEEDRDWEVFVASDGFLSIRQKV